jgi:putative membrane protein
MGFHPVHDYYGSGGWLWSIFSTALFIGLFAAAIMLLVRLFSGPRQPGVGAGSGYGPGAARRAPEAEGAERILAERYARGEISEEEYQGRLEVLRRSAAGWMRPQWQGQQQAGAQARYAAEPQPSETPPRQVGEQERRAAYAVAQEVGEQERRAAYAAAQAQPMRPPVQPPESASASSSEASEGQAGEDRTEG